MSNRAGYLRRLLTQGPLPLSNNKIISEIRGKESFEILNLLAKGMPG